MLLLLTVLSVATSALAEEANLAEIRIGCWKTAYGRGVGKPISVCRPNEEQNGLLCYPFCQEGYKGVGPVCWQNCPPSFRDDGAFCFKPSPYGRGAGYALWNEDKCHRENQDVGGCEKWGLMWYPKCKVGFHNVACCICSPNCINGMTDIGVSCAKKSYGRGAGNPLTCKPQEDLSGALCYPPCRDNYNGVGPVCWGQCPVGWKTCGALCVLYPEDCSGMIVDTLTNAITAVVGILIENPDMTIEAALNLATGLTFLKCPDPSLQRRLPAARLPSK